MLKQILVTFLLPNLTTADLLMCILFFSTNCTSRSASCSLIQNLNSKKAAGPENIAIKYYKLASEWIANFLSNYFNMCIEHGYFPSALKLAKVNPVFKSGKRNFMNNYRPISLLLVSPLTKVFENLISTTLTKFLEENNILADQQLGFRKGHSTTQAVTDIKNYLFTNL